jgi:hypothetical protein
MSRESIIIKSASQINYSYATIRVRQSRIDKGFIPIPTSLVSWFPDRNTSIHVHLDDSPSSELKGYSASSGKTKECRIGGLRQWFLANGIKSGDEIVVQVIDKESHIYRLIPEKSFLATTLHLQNGFDSSTDEADARTELARLSAWTNTEPSAVILNEYRRLADGSSDVTRPVRVRRSRSRSRQNAPASMRTLLGRIFDGHCQVCDFWFRKRNNEPYFEVHHLDPKKGHHPKNLVVVCGNCHNQFEHANTHTVFDEDWWLTTVFFNGICHSVHQIGPSTTTLGFSKNLYL